MLDLNFVRDNLPLVGEKLRLRGLDPGDVLKDFLEVAAQRRQAVTEAETTKARRNRASAFTASSSSTPGSSTDS